MAIDEDKLNAFMGRFVGDLGAVMHAATIVVGDQARPVQDAGRRRRPTSTNLARPHRDRRALPARMAVGAGRQRLRRVRPGQRNASADARSRPSRWPQEGSPAFIPGAFQIAVAHVQGRCRRWPRPCRTGWAWAGTSTTPRCSTAPSASSAPATSANLVSHWIPALDGVDGEARGRRARRRRRLRPRRLDHLMAQAYPNVDLRRLRLPRAVDRAARASGRGGRRRRPRALRGRHGEGLPRRGLRPRRHLRLPARHGRPGRRRSATCAAAEARRHLADRRAVRQRRARGQPQPGRPHLLLRPRPSSARRHRARRRSAPASARRPARHACARW